MWQKGCGYVWGVGEDICLYEGSPLSLLSRESHSEGVLDLGCTHNVCGSLWLKAFEERSGRLARRLKHSQRTFFFGSGGQGSSVECTVWVELSEGRWFKMDVIQGDLPFLPSRSCMKEMQSMQRVI